MALSLILSRAVVEDSVPGKHWTPEDGGCEGIEHPNATVVPFEVIWSNLRLQMSYNSDKRNR